MDGILVRFADDDKELLVQRENIEQRVTLPWKPRDLSDYFVIFRRRRQREYRGRQWEYRGYHSLNSDFTTLQLT